MFKGHPWEGEIFGGIEYEWHMHTNYIMNIEFDIDFEPFIKFCKKEGINSHELTMKVCSRLSGKHLPQYVVAKNRKAYPARYPAGYVRKMSPDRDMLEWVAVREKDGRFTERLPRENFHPWVLYAMKRFPRFMYFVARRVFAYHETKGRYALMVTRNPMRGLGRPIVFSGTDYFCCFLLIPFGYKVRTIFGAPHAFGNVDYFEGFVKEFIEAMEKPETIPRELIEKKYRGIPQKSPEEAAAQRRYPFRKPKKDLMNRNSDEGLSS